MSVPGPHFHLFSESADPAEPGRWRFVLRSATGQTVLEAADEERQAGPERLELLAIVRGLEALDQPSRVTLVTASRNVQHGLRTGLAHWRENDWQWERYGKLAPVKNADLWQRIARVQSIHTLECRCPQPQGADDLASPPATSRATGARKRGSCPPAEPARRQLPGRQGRTLRIDGPHAPRSASSAGGDRPLPAARGLALGVQSVARTALRLWTAALQRTRSR